jgi:hypothetical protein
MKITDEMKIQICRDDFYETLKQAINSAGGSLTQDEKVCGNDGTKRTACGTPRRATYELNQT